jgi:hypothetical protein
MTPNNRGAAGRLRPRRALVVESRSIFGKAPTVRNAAVACRGLGDLQQAERCLQHAPHGRRRIRDRHGQAETPGLLGAVQRDGGRHEAAQQSLNEALTAELGASRR